MRASIWAPVTLLALATSRSIQKPYDPYSPEGAPNACIPEMYTYFRPGVKLPQQGVTLKLVQRVWETHAVVTQAAAIILRELLRYDVEIVQTDRAPLDDYQLLAEGVFDANMELWSTGKQALHEKWLAPGKAVFAGEHTMPQIIGIYVPDYFVKEFPLADYYEHLQLFEYLEKYAKTVPFRPIEIQCHPIEWNCPPWSVWYPPQCENPGSESGSCKAKLYHPSYTLDQGILEQWIINHGFHIAVVYLPWEDFKKQIWRSYGRREAALFHLWEPMAPIHGRFVSSFVRVRFPPMNVTKVVGFSNSPFGDLDTEFESPLLLKVTSPFLYAQSDAFNFVTKFTLTHEDFERLGIWLNRIADVRRAACEWILEVGVERWNTWATHTKKPSVDFASSCAWVLYGHVVVLLISLSFYFWRGDGANTRTVAALQSMKSQLWHASQRNVRAVVTRRPALGYLQDTRSEEAWLSVSRSVSRVVAKSELRDSHSTVERYIVKSFFMSCFLRSTWSALNMSLMASFLGILMGLFYTANVKTLVDEYTPDPDSSFSKHFKHITELGNLLFGDYKFLPVFLLTMFVNAERGRWLETLGYGLSLQGKLHDLAVILSGAFDLQDAREREFRKTHFKFYRYLNVFHYLTYLGLEHRVGKDAAAARRQLVNAGFLTDEESNLLRKSDARIRETMVAWISCLWEDQVRAGYVGSEVTQMFLERLITMRSMAGGLQDCYDLGQPSTMKVLIELSARVCLLFIIGTYPFRAFTSERCVQAETMVTSFLMCWLYCALLTAIWELRKGPFDYTGDCVNVDNLLCLSDEVIIHTMRCNYSTVKTQSTESLATENLAEMYDLPRGSSYLVL